jgi:repressor LexA
MDVLTRRQREIFNFLRDNSAGFAYPPSLDQLCAALGMALARLVAQAHHGLG